MIRQKPFRPLSLALLLAATVVSVAGCTAAATPSTQASHSASAPTSAQPTATPAAFSIPCEDLVPSPVLQSVDPNLTPDTSFSPQAGTYPAEISTLNGTICAWKDPSGQSLVVAVAKPSASVLKTEQAKVAAGSTPTSVFGSGISAYTANSGGTASGDTEIFTPAGYWLSVVSPLFLNPSSAQPLVSAVLQALPSS
jgi:hypothetical protein